MPGICYSHCFFCLDLIQFFILRQQRKRLPKKEGREEGEKKKKKTRLDISLFLSLLTYTQKVLINPGLNSHPEITATTCPTENLPVVFIRLRLSSSIASCPRYAQCVTLATLSSPAASFTSGLKHVKTSSLGRPTEELGPALLDARFLYLFSYRDAGKTVKSCMRYWNWVRTTIPRYTDMLTSRCNRVWGGAPIPSSAELTQLCHTLHGMNFLIDFYVTSKLPLFGGEGPAAAAPSRTEYLRLLRAFYRQQILCNAWVPKRRVPRRVFYRFIDDEIDFEEHSRHHPGMELPCLLVPWELQVDYIDHSVSRVYAALYRSVTKISPGTMDQFQFSIDTSPRVEPLVRYIREHPPDIADPALRGLPSPLQYWDT